MRPSPSQGCDLLALPLDTPTESLPTLAEALDAFDADLYLAGRSTATRQTYRYLLKPLRLLRGDSNAAPDTDGEAAGSWPATQSVGRTETPEQGQWPATNARADQAHELYVTDFTAALCRSHLADRIRRKQATSTIVTAHGALSAFANWLVSMHYLDVSPMQSIPAPKIKPKPHRYLSLDEMRRLWQAALTSRRKPAENCLILLLLAEGLRANELVSLRWSDVKEDRIIVAFGKGGTVRSIALTEALKLALQARRQDRASSDTSGQRFVSENNDVKDRIIACNVNSLEARLALLGKRAKVAHVHPHLFRTSWATHWMLTAGVESIEAMRILGGWRPGSSMPQRYARSVMEEAALNRSRAVGLDLYGIAPHGERSQSASPPPDESGEHKEA